MRKLNLLILGLFFFQTILWSDPATTTAVLKNLEATRQQVKLTLEGVKTSAQMAKNAKAEIERARDVVNRLQNIDDEVNAKFKALGKQYSSLTDGTYNWGSYDELEKNMDAIIKTSDVSIALLDNALKASYWSPTASYSSNYFKEKYSDFDNYYNAHSQEDGFNEALKYTAKTYLFDRVTFDLFKTENRKIVNEVIFEEMDRSGDSYAINYETLKEIMNATPEEAIELQKLYFKQPYDTKNEEYLKNLTLIETQINFLKQSIKNFNNELTNLVLAEFPKYAETDKTEFSNNEEKIGYLSNISNWKYKRIPNSDKNIERYQTYLSLKQNIFDINNKIFESQSKLIALLAQEDETNSKIFENTKKQIKTEHLKNVSLSFLYSSIIR